MRTLSSLAVAADPSRAAWDRDHQALDAIAHGVLVVDRAGSLLRCNAGAARMLGTTADERLLDIVRDPVSRTLRSGEVSHAVVEVAGNRPLAVTARPLEAGGNGEVVVELAEVPEEPVAVDEPAPDPEPAPEAEPDVVDDTPARLRAVFEHVPLPWTLATMDGEIVAVNPAACAFFGWPEAELVGSRTSMAHLEQLLSGAIDTYVDEKPWRRNDGEVRWGRISVSLLRDDDRTPRYCTTLTEDITAQKRAEAAQERIHDERTGLPNRALLFDRLSQALTRSHAHVGVLVCEVDGADDEALVGLTERITAVLRPTETLAHLDGNELVVLCDDLTRRDQAVAVARAVVAAVGDGAPVWIGVAESVGREVSADELLAEGGTAKDRAKERGPGTVHVAG